MATLLRPGDVTRLFDCECGLPLVIVQQRDELPCELRHGAGEAARRFAMVEWNPDTGWDADVRAWLDEVHAYEVGASNSTARDIR